VSNDDRVLEIAGAIADGSPLEWDDVDVTPDDAFGALRIIAEIAALHRGLPSELSTTLTSDALPRQPDRPDLSRAERWGPLLLLERVGGGGFGEVFRAWDAALDHEVALKLLRVPPRALASPECSDEPASSTIVREGQLLARVRHPNVITVHGALELNGQVGIWMDFLRGRTLDQVVRDEGPMSAAEAAIVGDSLSRALAAVHRVGLLHRDIKATNVMREAGGRIVLLDFGTGSELTVASAQAARRRIVGTPLYLAPELFDGAAPSVESDLYSFGVLLFYLVTGAYPVPGRSVEDIYSAHHSGRRVLLSDLRPDLPRSFVAVVERALSPAPAERYRSAGAMLHDLTATAPSPRMPAQEAARTSAAVWALWASCGIAGAFAVVAALGYVTSTVFNLHLGIGGDFATEGPLAYAVLGAMNLVPTLFYMAVAVLLFYAAAAVVQLAVAAVPALGRAGLGARRALQRQARRLNLDAGDTPAKMVCAAGAVLFGTICWVFRDLIAGVLSEVNTAPMEALSVLHPTHVRTHSLYGLSLDMLLLMLLWAAVRLLRARLTSPVSTGPVLGIVALAGVALLFHAGAWRVLFLNEFRQATFENQTCYVLARSTDEWLLHCPQAPPPRNRVVARTDARLSLTGVVEPVSNAFVPGATPPARE
jgi:hypothetical protein